MLLKRLLVVLAVAGTLGITAMLLHLHDRHAARASTDRAGDPPAALTTLDEDFSVPALDPRVWEVVHDGTLSRWIAETDPANHQLRLGLACDGTPAEPLKVVEVRTRAPIDLTAARRIELTIHWPQQETAYLGAGVLLAPGPPLTGTGSLRAGNWLRWEYIGVPPGNGARAALYTSKDGHIAWLYDDGWPLPNAQGRAVATLRVTLRVNGRTVAVDENGKTLVNAAPAGIDLSRAWLSLFVTSRAGMPLREVRFSDLRVGGG